MKKHFFLLALSLLIFSFVEPEPIRVFLIGDSTMANKQPADYPETGWGIPFRLLFNEAVEVQNHAYNGRSTKSFRTEGRWQKVFEQIKKGDYVIIQFGHNDAKLSDTSRYAEAQTDYRKNLTRYIQETRSKGGIPIVLSSIQRRKFDSLGHFVDQHGDYPRVAKEVATKEKVLFIDMEAKSRALIEKLGLDASEKIFLHLPPGIYKKYKKGVSDDTHFTVYGAQIMANFVAQGIAESTEHLKSFLKKSAFNQKYQFEIPVVSKPVFKLDTLNIKNYGAKTGPTFNNAIAIQQAIDQTHQNGGGVVLIPKGLWVSGPIELKSNVNLHIEQGAILQFSDNSADYPLVKTFWEGVEAIRAQSPISGKNVRKIAITGQGVIDGAGEAWRPVKKQKLTAGEWENLVQSGGVLNEKKDTWYPTQRALKGSLNPLSGRTDAGFNLENATEIKEFLRPNLLSLIQCDEIILDGFTIQNSPAWTIHPLLCTHVTMSNLMVKNPWYAQNSDGLDIESCEYVNVNNCKIDVGDDGICLKSGKDEQGRKRGKPTAYVNIENSQVFHGHGGVVVGSEMSGGVHDIFVDNCQFLGTDVGLRFKTARGRGGIVENIYIQNIAMKNIAGEAIIMDMYYQGKDPVSTFGNGSEEVKAKLEPVNEGTPQFRSIYMDNIQVKGAATGIMLRGLPEMPIKDIHMSNLAIEAKIPKKIVDVKNVEIPISLLSPN
ncbi:MAG: glycosyl hydrolase family 28 protein [Aquirufa sp.]